MKKFIMATVISACIALCAAVWPQSKAPEETPTPPPTPAVCAPEATVAECNTEVQTTPPAEKEKVPPTEVPTEIHAEPEPAPIEAPTVPEVHLTPEPGMTSEATPEPAPEPTPELPAAQTAVEPQAGNMVYVPGFGWIESQGPNRVEYAADMYENGNKIGIMG